MNAKSMHDLTNLTKYARMTKKDNSTLRSHSGCHTLFPLVLKRHNK